MNEIGKLNANTNHQPHIAVLRFSQIIVRIVRLSSTISAEGDQHDYMHYPSCSHICGHQCDQQSTRIRSDLITSMIIKCENIKDQLHISDEVH